jgi:hypothetical protein
MAAIDSLSLNFDIHCIKNISDGSALWTLENRLYFEFYKIQMKTKTILFIFLMVHLVILLFIGGTWFKFNQDVALNGGEMSDGLFAGALVVATLFYVALTIWTFAAYKMSTHNPRRARLQMGVIFILDFLAAFLLFEKGFL